MKSLKLSKLLNRFACHVLRSKFLVDTCCTWQLFSKSRQNIIQLSTKTIAVFCRYHRVGISKLCKETFHARIENIKFVTYDFNRIKIQYSYHSHAHVIHHIICNGHGTVTVINLINCNTYKVRKQALPTLFQKR